MHGSFTPDSAEKFLELMREAGYETSSLPDSDGLQNFSELGINPGGAEGDVWSGNVADFGEVRGEYIENYDYTRCVKPDGTAYGTGGKCRKGTESDKQFESDGGVPTESSGGRIGGALFGKGNIATTPGQDRVTELVRNIQDKNGAFRKLVWPSTKLTPALTKKLLDIKATLKAESESLIKEILKLSNEKEGFIIKRNKDNSAKIEELRRQRDALYEAAVAVNKKLRQPKKLQTKTIEFSERELYDYTRCVRPDGTVYGTKGKCRKGTETEKEDSDREERYARGLALNGVPSPKTEKRVSMKELGFSKVPELLSNLEKAEKQGYKYIDYRHVYQDHSGLLTFKKKGEPTKEAKDTVTLSLKQLGGYDINKTVKVLKKLHDKGFTDINFSKIYEDGSGIIRLVKPYKEDFSEESTEDFTRCERPNGTVYGTSGTCRKGVEANKVDLNNPSTPLSSGDTPMEKIKSKLKQFEGVISDPNTTPSEKQLEQYGRLKNALDEIESVAPKKVVQKALQRLEKGHLHRMSFSPETRKMIQRAKFLVELGNGPKEEIIKSSSSSNLKTLAKKLENRAKEQDNLAEKLTVIWNPLFSPDRAYVNSKYYKFLSQNNHGTRNDLKKLINTLENESKRNKSSVNYINWVIDSREKEGKQQFSESEAYDFTRCVRPDGTVYGSRGKCKQGVEQAESTNNAAKVKPKRSTKEVKSEAEMTPDEIWGRNRMKVYNSLKGMSREQLISKYRQTSRLDLGSLKDLTVRDLKGAIVSSVHGNYSPSEIRERREAKVRAAQRRKEAPTADHNEFEDSYDYTRCVRPDGSAYGTGGTCRKGTPAEKEEHDALSQLQSMLPKGEKIVTSSGKVFGSETGNKSESDEALGKVKIHDKDSVKGLSDEELRSQVENANKAAFGKGSTVSNITMQNLKEQHDLADAELTRRKTEGKKGKPQELSGQHLANMMTRHSNIRNSVAAEHGGEIRSKAAKERFAAELKKAGVPDAPTIKAALAAQREKELSGGARPKRGSAQEQLDGAKKKLGEISDKINKIVASGGKVGLSDPLSKQLKAQAAKVKELKAKAEKENASPVAPVPAKTIKDPVPGILRRQAEVKKIIADRPDTPNAIRDSKGRPLKLTPERLKALSQEDLEKEWNKAFTSVRKNSLKKEIDRREAEAKQKAE